MNDLATYHRVYVTALDNLDCIDGYYAEHVYFHLPGWVSFTALGWFGVGHTDAADPPLKITLPAWRVTEVVAPEGS